MRIASSKNNISAIDGNIDVIQIHDINIVIYYWWNSSRYRDLAMEMIWEGYSVYKVEKNGIRRKYALRVHIFP